MSKYSILCVCTDNLCRSPMAAEVLRQAIIQHGLSDQIEVDSAATHDFNVGEPADIRAQKHAMRQGYDIARFRARLISSEDFERFDQILAMEESNLLTLRLRCPPRHKDKLHFFMAYRDDQVPQDVPDPFYGESEDFELVLALAKEASEGWLQSGLWTQQADSE